MAAPFPTIPSGATPFFVEDSFSLMVQPGNPWPFNPGAANTGYVANPGDIVTAWVTGGNFQLTPNPGSGAGFNTDVYLELYDVSTGTAVPTGALFAMAPPYGSALGTPIMSSSNSDKQDGQAQFVGTPEQPLVLTATAPGTGKFQVGPRFNFNSSLTGPWRCEYFYQLMGAWTSQAGPPPRACLTPTVSATLLMHCDAMPFVDASGHTLTAHGNATISTAAPKFGTGNYQGAAASDYVSSASSADWDLRGVDSTIDMWVNFQGFPGSINPLIGCSQAANDGQWFAYVYNNGAVAIGANGVNQLASANGALVADGKWHHLAFVRQNVSGTTTIYVDGVSVATATTNWTTASAQLNIGAGGGTSGYTPQMDEVRIIKGTAYWTTDFTPPTLPWCS